MSGNKLSGNKEAKLSSKLIIWAVDMFFGNTKKLFKIKYQLLVET